MRRPRGWFMFTADMFAGTIAATISGTERTWLYFADTVTVPDADTIGTADSGSPLGQTFASKMATTTGTRRPAGRTKRRPRIKRSRIESVRLREHGRDDPPHHSIHGGLIRVSSVKHVHSDRRGCVFQPHHQTWFFVEGHKPIPARLRSFLDRGALVDRTMSECGMGLTIVDCGLRHSNLPPLLSFVIGHSSFSVAVACTDRCIYTRRWLWRATSSSLGAG